MKLRGLTAIVCVKSDSLLTQRPAVKSDCAANASTSATAIAGTIHDLAPIRDINAPAASATPIIAG